MNVVVEGEHSESAYVESGVPQGTVLGPLMFLCHINDLPDCVKSQVRLFADDCLIYRQIKTQKDHQILQNDLKELENWAAKWGMRFNAKKCYILSIRQKSSHFYQLDGEQGCILAGISFLSISSILLPTRKSGIRRDKYLSAAIFKEAVHSDDS